MGGDDLDLSRGGGVYVYGRWGSARIVYGSWDFVGLIAMVLREFAL